VQLEDMTDSLPLQQVQTNVRSFIKAGQSIPTFEKLDEYDTSERMYNSE